MRIILGVWLTILVLGLFTTGSTVAPCYATTSNSPVKEAIPIITNATLSSEETAPSKVAFQTSYLSLSLRTDKQVYLTGETVSITVSTNAVNTYVRVLAQLPNGQQETVGSFTINNTRTLSWTAPSTPGQVKLTCEGEALVEVWSTCSRVVCEDEDCWWESYPCLRTTTVTGNAFYDISVFSRSTSISGHVTDTNQRPVSMADVYLTSTMQSTTTNNDGFYDFTSYQLGNNYTLINQIPTVTETVSVEAIACEPQPGKTIQVQAEHGATDVNFTLRRAFYPADIDLSEFTSDAFSGWPEAEEYSTWQNILGITIDGQVEPKKLLFGTKEISAPLFDIDNKKLYLVSKPEFGRYFLEVQGTPNTEYTVAAATTLNSLYLEPVTTSGALGSQNSQRIRLMLEPDGMELKVIKPLPLPLIIIPTAVGLIGGLAAAYFLTGGRLPGIKKLSAGRKPPKQKKTARTKIKEDPSATKIKEKSTAKRSKKKAG